MVSLDSVLEELKQELKNSQTEVQELRIEARELTSRCQGLEVTKTVNDAELTKLKAALEASAPPASGGGYGWAVAILKVRLRNMLKREAGHLAQSDNMRVRNAELETLLDVAAREQSHSVNEKAYEALQASNARLSRDLTQAQEDLKLLRGEELSLDEKHIKERTRLEGLLEESAERERLLDKELEAALEELEIKVGENEAMAREASQRDREHYEAVIDARDSEMERLKSNMEAMKAVSTDASKNRAKAKAELAEEYGSLQEKLEKDYEVRLSYILNIEY